MAMCVQTIKLPLPVLPQDWKADGDFKAVSTISAAPKRNLEPVGPHYLAYARRKRHRRTFSEDDRIVAAQNTKKIETEDDGEISEPEDLAMLMRDAKQWKEQDHYAVLGLSKYRFRATEKQIKNAHRKKVLRHHPDKKAAAGKTDEDNFFKCIQKATEILLDPVKRRQWDSVDPEANVEPPSKKAASKSPKAFYKLWGEVFDSEARFHDGAEPVPAFGTDDSTKAEVEAFYNFWYNFESWRTFEYEDEDVPDDNENRDQKRHVERKNASARKKKKTEDTARLRGLVDQVMAGDERIKRFKKEASAQKNKKRLDKEAEAKNAAEEAARKKEEEARLAREKEEAEKALKADSKKAKEALKNAAKKNKRVIRGAAKDANYFVEGAAPAATIEAVLNDVDVLITKSDNEDLAALTEKLNGKKDPGEIKAIYADEVKRLVGAGKLNASDCKSLA